MTEALHAHINLARSCDDGFNMNSEAVEELVDGEPMVVFDAALLARTPIAVLSKNVIRINI